MPSAASTDVHLESIPDDDDDRHTYTPQAQTQQGETRLPETPEELEAIARAIEERSRQARQTSHFESSDAPRAPNMEDPGIWRIRVRVSDAYVLLQKFR